MRISELVKTYRLLNDPDAPSWNVKFVGAIGVLAAVALAVGGLYWASLPEGDASAPGAVASSSQPGGERVDYVGFTPGSVPVDSAAVEGALASWRAAHPGATILSQEPSHSATGSVVGYTLRYRP